MLVLLTLQSLVLAGWVVVTLGLLSGMGWRAVADRRAVPDMAPRPPYLRDPGTRVRRIVWCVLTAALAVLAAITTVTLASA